MEIESAKGISGQVYSYESCGTVDGPGVRFVVFLQGCHLRCLYCHNPETWTFKNGQKIPAEEVFAEIKKYKNFMKSSGGGVTFSGGEPLAQPRFLEALLNLCKEEGIHRVVDTSGFTKLTDTVKRIIDLTDIFLLDIKSINSNMHQIITGVPNTQNLEFAEYLGKIKKPVILRYVLVPYLNDRGHCIEKLARWAVNQGNVIKVDILPFHKMGEYKWEELNQPYRLSETSEPTPEEVRKIADIFESHGLVVE